MKETIKKYKVYEFEELSEKIQKEHVDFDFMHMFSPQEMGKVVTNKKALKNSLDYIKEHKKQLLYLKDGTVCVNKNKEIK